MRTTEEVRERTELTWDEGDEASQGDCSPEVIPPEHALLDTKGKASNGDRGGDYEERQGGICGGTDGE